MSIEFAAVQERSREFKKMHETVSGADLGLRRTGAHWRELKHSSEAVTGV